MIILGEIIFLGAPCQKWPKSGGQKTARRAAERPPAGKLKLSRVTLGYGGLKIPLGWIRLTPKNGGYMGVA